MVKIFRKAFKNLFQSRGYVIYVRFGSDSIGSKQDSGKEFEMQQALMEIVHSIVTESECQTILGEDKQRMIE